MARIAKTEEEKAFATILANPELFGLTAEKVAEVQAKFDSEAATRIVRRKVADGTSDKNVQNGVTLLQNVSAWVTDFIVPSGTSGNRRIGIPTDHGTLTVELAD